MEDVIHQRGRVPRDGPALPSTLILSEMVGICELHPSPALTLTGSAEQPLLEKLQSLWREWLGSVFGNESCAPDSLLKWLDANEHVDT